MKTLEQKKEYYRNYHKKWDKKQVDNLTDNYILQTLIKYNGGKRDIYRENYIFIETYRILLQIKREIRKQSEKCLKTIKVKKIKNSQIRKIRKPIPINFQLMVEMRKAQLLGQILSYERSKILEENYLSYLNKSKINK